MLLAPATPRINVGCPHHAWRLRPPEIKMSTLRAGVWGCKAPLWSCPSLIACILKHWSLSDRGRRIQVFSVRGGRILFLSGPCLHSLAWAGAALLA